MPLQKPPIIAPPGTLCNLCFRPIPQGAKRKDYLSLVEDVFAHTECVSEQIRFEPGQLAVVNHAYGAQSLSVEGQPSISRLPFGSVVPIVAVGSPPNQVGVFYLSHRRTSLIWYEAYYLNPSPGLVPLNKSRREAINGNHLKSVMRLGYTLEDIDLLKYGVEQRTRSRIALVDW